MIDQESKLKDINMSAVKRSKKLQEIDEEKLRCLEIYEACAPLVKWLQKEFTNGLQDLKTFVDLALISAGEGDINIDKVMCLQTSVVVYAPLIFELQKAKQCGSDKLLEICENVWINLTQQPKAPAKLNDTKRDLEWFESVKRATGEVQVTALNEAGAINERGYFRIGNIGQKDIRQGGELTLSDIIELSVPPGDDEEEQRRHSKERKYTHGVKTYTFDDLTELQSRMMLVAGRKSDTHISGQTLSSSVSKRKSERDLARESMNKFTMTFDSIIRLAGTYTRLWSAGCILFKIWNAEIFCSISSGIGIRVTFGTGVKKEVYEGKTEDGDIFFWISRLSDFMENCLDLWMQYITEKRDEFFPLNFYTMDQIVILQKELSNQDGKESNTLYPLLKLVNENCSKTDVDKAKRKVQTRIDEEKLKLQLKKIQDDKNNSSEETQEEKEKRIFIEKLVKSGISKKLAMIALLHGGIKPTEPNKGKIWCMQNKGKENDLTVSSVGKRGKAEDIFDLWIDKTDKSTTESET